MPPSGYRGAECFGGFAPFSTVFRMPASSENPFPPKACRPFRILRQSNGGIGRKRMGHAPPGLAATSNKGLKRPLVREEP